MSRGHRLEIMAPAGCFEALTAAVQAGADSVYFGVEDLNMRSHSANNFTLADLPEIVRYCSEHDVKTYLALNIILYDEDVPKAYSTLDAAKAAGVTAVIASDITTIEYARRIGLEVHISTQLNISNTEALRFYSQYADVVVLARELNLEQVRAISDRIASEGITGPSGRPVQIEMFCHGALCMAVSGKCYLSLHENGKSANRGSCLQLCRRGYRVTDLETGYELEIDNKYIMSPKDLCTIEFLDKMAAAGVSVFKIEGRARPAEYVQKVVSAYRAAADAVEAGTFTPEFGASFRDQLSGRLLPGCPSGRVEQCLRQQRDHEEGLCRQGEQLFLQPRSGRDPGRGRPAESRSAHPHHRPHYRSSRDGHPRDPRRPRPLRHRPPGRRLLHPRTLPRPPRRQALHLRAEIKRVKVRVLNSRKYVEMRVLEC